MAPDHYAALGLARRCSEEQVRVAYRLLIRQHHPDINGAADSLARSQALNIAYETLSDPVRRREYDRELAADERSARPARVGRIERNISQDAHLRLEDFLRGATLDVRVNDPGNAGESELYELTVPPETAPGARLRVPREGRFEGGFVIVRLRARPDGRFKARGSDLRCDLRIHARRAAEGGSESVRGLAGNVLRLQVPPGIGRGEVLKIAGEGLPKPRGGRGDLLVRITYRPEVRITRR